MSSLLNLERQQEDFQKSIPNSHFTLYFLFIWNWNDEHIHALPYSPWKPCPNSGLNRQSLYRYPFSKHGAKTIPFGAALTYKANIRKTSVNDKLSQFLIQQMYLQPLSHQTLQTIKMNFEKQLPNQVFLKPKLQSASFNLLQLCPSVPCFVFAFF